jgi:hypothetical protein
MAWITISDDLRPVDPGDRDDLEQGAGAIGTEVPGLAIVLFPDRERVVNRVDDVVVDAAVLAGRSVDLHRLGELRWLPGLLEFLGFECLLPARPQVNGYAEGVGFGGSWLSLHVCRFSAFRRGGRGLRVHR